MKLVCIMYRENERVSLAADRLAQALASVGYVVSKECPPSCLSQIRKKQGKKVLLGVRGSDSLLAVLEEQDLLIYHSGFPSGEGFSLTSCAGDLTVISGGSDIGVLYGTLELCERVTSTGDLPREISFLDAPAFELRGPAIGLQKTTIDPGRMTYEYPITPDRFPWFYDKPMWLAMLDQLLLMRCNVLYIWQGHPFSSLVKLQDYPEALEVSESDYEQNREVFSWLTREASRRGIWIVLKFYNIHIPLPFSTHHSLEHLQTFPLPITADYTRKSVAKFVEDFPHVGLMVCLGEALSGLQNQIDWFCDTILPGVKDGMRAANLQDEPPIILRGHNTDPVIVLDHARKVYNNLYTMWKYNGEGLTTWTPRGNWTKTHRVLGNLHSTHIVNVHIVANLEPFRFGSPSFIQKCVQASKHLYGANGLHLYPLFYWGWPYAPDRAEQPLLQMERDWLWFAAWFRYAWNPERDDLLERLYWENVLAKRFGSTEAGKLMLHAYESAGECAPRLLRRFGITEGNRQTLSLGMYMTQLTNPERYMPNVELWHSCAPQGEQLQTYVSREKTGNHVGETPIDVINDVEYYALRAFSAAHAALPFAKTAVAEAHAIASDTEAIMLMSLSYTSKIRAAMDVLRYRRDMDSAMHGDTSLLRQAQEHLRTSLDYYRKLTKLTSETYLYANSLQIPQRRIPEPDGGAFDHWNKMLPKYEEEYLLFSKHVADIEQGVFPQVQLEGARAPLRTVPYILHDTDLYTMSLSSKGSAFSDVSKPILSYVIELECCVSVCMSESEAARSGRPLNIELLDDAYILIGYFNSDNKRYLQPAKLELNTHADARGGLEPVMRDAIRVSYAPSVNVHAFSYKKGKHQIYLGVGAFLMIGAVAKDQNIEVSSTAMENEKLRTLDWMFE